MTPGAPAVTVGDDARPPSRLARLAVVHAGLVGPLVVALATHRHGINVSPDSLTYLRGADVLAADGAGGVTSFPTALYPPGLSAALAPAAALGVEVQAARWLNIALVAAVAIAVGLFLVRHVRPVLAVAAAGLVGVGYPVVHAASWLTSEPLYAALTVVHLGLLAGLVGTRRPQVLAAAAGLAAALAVLVRYSGVAILPVGVLAVLLIAPPGGRLRRLACYAAPLALVAGGWLLRNILLTGYATGDRASNERGLARVVVDGAGTLALWFAPPGLSEIRGAVVGAAVVLLLVVVATVAVVRLRGHGPLPLRGRPWLAVLLAGYVVTGALTLAVMVSATNTDPMGHRLLAPLWPALVALVVVGVDLALDRAPAPGPWGPARVAGLAGAVVLVPALAAALAVTRTADAAADGEWTGAGFNGPRWQSDAVRTLVAAAPPTSFLISNEPYGVMTVSGRETDESPRYTAYASTQASEDSVAKFLATGQTRESYLLWLVVDGETDDHLPPPELARHATLVPVASTSAGQTYRVVPPTTSPVRPAPPPAVAPR